jgi:hypothetical protein
MTKCNGRAHRKAASRKFRLQLQRPSVFQQHVTQDLCPQVVIAETPLPMLQLATRGCRWNVFLSLRRIPGLLQLRSATMSPFPFETVTVLYARANVL